MPLSPITLTPVIAIGLLATGHIGMAMPQLATGVANGACDFLVQSVVVTVDVGTLGVGTGSAPLVVPQPSFLSALLVGFAAQQILGIFSPLTATGLANGISQGLQQGTMITNHPGVGSGACVAKVVGGSAIPFMIKGFKDAGMSGPDTNKKATAVGIAFDIVFGGFSMPIPIVGPPTPSGGSGVGVGFIL